MAYAKRFIFLLGRILPALVFLACCCRSAGAAGPSSPSARSLLATYPAIKTNLEKNQFGAPIYVESAEDKDSLHVNVYGIFNYPFDTLSDALQSPGNWCRFTSLHINIKACSCTKAGTQRLMTLYSGRKFYQPPEDAYRLDFTFHIAERSHDYLDIILTADEGPLFTSDHRIRLEAAPLEKGKTFVRFSYSYRFSVPARAAINAYFATLARDKVGFSIIGTDKTGGPVLVGGGRGAIERNAVRYYLALQAYLDTLQFAEDLRFEKRIARWYALTAQYPRQLHEMTRDEYIAIKRHEHENQLMLQKGKGCS